MDPGWNGQYFEDIAVGDRYEHPRHRTVLPADTTSFTLVTHKAAPLHDDHAPEQLACDRPPVDATFLLALVLGQSAADVAMHACSDLAFERVEMPHPLFEGDTVYSRSTVMGTRRSMSRPDVGIVRLQTEGYNQDGVTVIRFERFVMVYLRGEGPDSSRPTVEEPACTSPTR